MINRRVLIVSPNWVGDAVMAQPLLRLLKTRADFENTAIDVLSSPALAAVWQAVPEVENVIEASFKSGAFEWQKRRALAKKLRACHYAQAYILPNSLKSAFIPWLARIPQRIGYRGEMRYGLLNVMHRDAGAEPRPMVKFYAALASAPTKNLPNELIAPRPVMVISDQRQQDVLRHFEIRASSPVVAFAPGAEFGSAKRWPGSHFAALAQLILQQYKTATILLLGSPKDKTICEEIVATLSQVTGIRNLANLRNLAGTTSLAEAIAVLAASRVVVSNDSGLLHISSALNRPVIALYGPTDPNHAPPLSDIAQSMYLHLSCMPCRQRECPLAHHDCMRKLYPEIVWKPLQSILNSG